MSCRTNDKARDVLQYRRMLAAFSLITGRDIEQVTRLCERGALRPWQIETTINAARFTTSEMRGVCDFVDIERNKCREHLQDNIERANAQIMRAMREMRLKTTKEERKSELKEIMKTLQKRAEKWQKQI